MRSFALRFPRRHAVLLALCVTLTPLAHARDDAAGALPVELATQPEPAVATEPGAFVPATFVAAVSATVQTAAGQVLQSAQHVTDYALDLIGVRYKFGGTTPTNGLDCSGLVKYVFEQVTGVTLPRSAREQAKVGTSVELDSLQPGDLVFFNTRRHAFSHVGIYVGDNSFIHSPNRRGSVMVTNIDAQYWRSHFNGARRLLGVMPGGVSMQAAKSVLQSLPAFSDATEK